MVGKKKLGGVWASPADLFLPGRQRGLEGGELTRGNSWERRRLGLVSRGSLFPSELMGLEDEPQPRQSIQASPGLQWFETLVSRSGRGDEQGLQILGRNHFLAWVNCLLGECMHPSALGGGGVITDSGRSAFHSDTSSVAFFWKPLAGGRSSGRH